MHAQAIAKASEKMRKQHTPTGGNRRTLYGGQETCATEFYPLIDVDKTGRFFNMNKNKDGYYRESFPRFGQAR